MATDNRIKLKLTLAHHTQGTVDLGSWLEQLGISHDLQKYYRKSGWMESIGTGAMKRPGEEVTWQGALYTLQTQAKLTLHAGALTALALQGFAHYVRLGKQTVYLFSPIKTRLPAWFRKYDWPQLIIHERTSFLPNDIGITDLQLPLFSIRISSAERAILECLYLSPDTLNLVECYQIMEGLTTLRPRVVQDLLEQCRSIRVKRLFLYMAEKAGHEWYKRLDHAKLDLGKGARSIVKGGVYVEKYALNLPEELVKL